MRISWKRYNNYSHKRKKTHKETNKRIRSLLYILDKIINQLLDVEQMHQASLNLPDKYYSRLKIVRKVLKQQQENLSIREKRTGSYCEHIKIVYKTHCQRQGSEVS